MYHKKRIDHAAYAPGYFRRGLSRAQVRHEMLDLKWHTVHELACRLDDVIPAECKLRIESYDRKSGWCRPSDIMHVRLFNGTCRIILLLLSALFRDGSVEKKAAGDLIVYRLKGQGVDRDGNLVRKAKT